MPLSVVDSNWQGFSIAVIVCLSGQGIKGANKGETILIGRLPDRKAVRD
jgi:hypothetical protein